MNGAMRCSERSKRVYMCRGVNGTVTVWQSLGTRVRKKTPCNYANMGQPYSFGLTGQIMPRQAANDLSMDLLGGGQFGF